MWVPDDSEPEGGVRIREHHPALGEHRERTVRTGTCCSYLPDPGVRAGWRF